MRFKGQLLLPDEPGPGLRVDLDLAEHHLAVESDGGGLGAWPLEVVDVERLQGDVFALTVAGEPLQFIADDTIEFAYSAVPAIEKFAYRRPRTRSALRSMFDRIWNGPDETPSPPAEPQAPEDPAAVDEPADEAGLLDGIFPPQPEPEALPDTGHVPKDPVAETEVVVEGVENSVAPPEQSPMVDEGVDTRTCPGTTSDGRPCESQILTSSGYCYNHDPKRAFEDKYKDALAARDQLKRDSTARLNRIYSRLDKAMRQVERGELDPETAAAMAQLARTMCAILDMDGPPRGDDHR